MNIVRTQLLILGSGPAGWTAALYAARANFQPLVVAGIQPGGQLTTTTDVDNWPAAAEGVQGPELMERFQRHALRFGAQLTQDHIQSADFSRRPLRLTGGAAVYECDALIIATGASAKYLGLESESRFLGRGVSACATCDGFFFKEQQVLVIGGGNTAVEESLYLANIAAHVTLVHRRHSLRAEKILQDKLFARTNVKIAFGHTLAEVLGDERGVNGARLHDTTSGKTHDIEVNGIFIAIGHTPNTALFAGQLKMHDGYICTGDGDMVTATSMNGVFAAGDVQDRVYRQAITSASSGCMAALDAQRFLETNIMGEDKEKDFVTIVEAEGIGFPPIFNSTTVPKKSLPRLAPDIGNEDAYINKHEFLRNGIDRRRLEKLLHKKPAATMDLHGMTAAEAHATLDNFIVTALTDGKRHVEVIHGRGLHNAERRAVLRDKVRKWLCNTPTVLGYASNNSNTGAMRVLLQRGK